jgi:D-alanine---(R)-lactate ligase
LPALRERGVVARVRLAVLFGGTSEEHDVSVKSAREVARCLDPEKYQPFYVGITRDGRWRLCDGPDTDWECDGLPTAVLSPDRGHGGLLVSERGHTFAVGVDVVLPVLHGAGGEDGAVQGLLELSGIPYVGCDVQASALCMDKALAYDVVRQAGFRTPEFRVVTADQDVDPDRLTYPVFVKPARSGSSFGVSRVARPEELPEALASARRYDPKVLVEDAVSGREVGCAVLGNGSDLVTGEPDRIALSHGFFRIHQEDQPEVRSENATVIVPADISARERSLARESGKAIYRALGCRGLARVDMFLRDDGTMVLNEVNTFPGLTSYSRYPKMMAAAGMPLGEVLDRVVSLALESGAA